MYVKCAVVQWAVKNPLAVSLSVLSHLSPAVTFGSWFDHVKGWISAEDKDHILYMSYEEMIAVSSAPVCSSDKATLKHSLIVRCCLVLRRT